MTPTPADHAAPGGRRILLVAYHFPPSVAVGALRWEKLVGLLAREGYAFDVLTLEPAQLARSDERRLRALPAGVRVFGVRHDLPVAERAWNALARATKSFRSGSRGGHRQVATGGDADGSPDGDAGGGVRAAINARLHALNELTWARRAARVGISHARRAPYDAVITSGPPHFLHLAGTLVHEATGIPHIADFRDPWRLAESVSRDVDAPIHHVLASTHETRVVSGAAHVVMNTAAAAAAMRATYPHLATRITHVMNGSDPEDRVASPARERFTLLYAGSLYLQRDPRVLFRACASLVARQRLAPEQFAIRFLGPTDSYDGVPIAELAEPFGLRRHVIVDGMVPRAQALTAAAEATMLVCLPDGQRLTVPAKLFEYVQLDAWLLAFAEPGSAMAMALEGTTADVVAPGDADMAARRIEARWAEFDAGTRPVAPDAAGRLARGAQAARLRELLDALPRAG